MSRMARLSRSSGCRRASETTSGSSRATTCWQKECDSGVSRKVDQRAGRLAGLPGEQLAVRPDEGDQGDGHPEHAGGQCAEAVEGVETAGGGRHPGTGGGRGRRGRVVLGRDAVAPCRLGPVQRPIGGLQQDASRVRGHPAGHTRADRDREVLRGRSRSQLRRDERAPDALGERLAGVHVGARQQDDELVTADPGGHVDASCLLRQHTAEALEDAIAGGVPADVVDALELIDVEADRGEPGIVARGPRQLDLQAFVEPPAVEQPGQRIDARLLGGLSDEPVVAAREHADDDGDDRHRDLDVEPPIDARVMGGQRRQREAVDDTDPHDDEHGAAGAEEVRGPDGRPHVQDARVAVGVRGGHRGADQRRAQGAEDEQHGRRQATPDQRQEQRGEQRPAARDQGQAGRPTRQQTLDQHQEHGSAVDRRCAGSKQSAVMTCHRLRYRPVHTRA
jgi:hypothetical protein